PNRARTTTSPGSASTPSRRWTSGSRPNPASRAQFRPPTHRNTSTAYDNPAAYPAGNDHASGPIRSGGIAAALSVAAPSGGVNAPRPPPLPRPPTPPPPTAT